VVKKAIYLFALLCIVFIPVQFNLCNLQQGITDGLFGSIIQLLGNLLGIDIKNPGVSSDSAAMYLLLLVLFILATIISFALNFIDKWKHKQDIIFQLLRTVFCYYLALHLLKYGFDKVFKYQFYLPEPNTLYTPVGGLSKDILYWTSMGTSYWYSVFAGSVEIIAALFLLFKKTRVLGLLLALGIMLNVMAINVGFDISVKLFSSFLILLILILVQPQFQRLYDFLILHKQVHLKNEPSYTEFFKNDSIIPTFKTLIICVFLIESQYPYAMARNFNDDMAQRPYLHGAYQVTNIINKTNEEQPQVPLKRIFIHRSGYIIFQDTNDAMQDYKLEIDQEKNQFELTNYDGQKVSLAYNYNSKNGILDLQYYHKSNEYLLITKALDWKKLPALQDEFHWSVDAIE
jgi:hypothetical protein